MIRFLKNLYNKAADYPYPEGYWVARYDPTGEYTYMYQNPKWKSDAYRPGEYRRKS